MRWHMGSFYKVSPGPGLYTHTPAPEVLETALPVTFSATTGMPCAVRASGSLHVVNRAPETQLLRTTRGGGCLRSFSAPDGAMQDSDCSLPETLWAKRKLPQAALRRSGRGTRQRRPVWPPTVNSSTWVHFQVRGVGLARKAPHSCGRDISLHSCGHGFRTRGPLVAVVFSSSSATSSFITQTLPLVSALPLGCVLT